MFPITMSFTISTEAELTRLVAAASNPEVAKVDPKPEKAAPAPKAEAAATTPTAQAAAAPEQKAENSDAKPASGKTVDDAKALTMKIVSDKGRDAAVELLKQYGVPVAAKLPADKIDAFCADAEAVLAS